MKILTVKQVAELLQMKLPTIYAMVEQQKIPHYKIGGAVRFREDEIVKWLDTHCRKAEAIWYNSEIQNRGSKKGGKV